VALPELVEVVRKSHGSASTGAKPGTAGIVGGGGLTGLLVGVLVYLREAVATPRKALGEVNRGRRALRKLSSRMRLLIAYAAGAVVGPALLLAVMVFALSLTLANSSSSSTNWWLVLGGAGALAVFGLLYAFADLTSWSLHPFYKRRLATAFALKRVRPSDLTENEDGHRAIAVAQDESLGVAAERDYDRLVPLSRTALHGHRWPTLIVCAAANVSDPGATPPGRHVTSFTFSAHAIGGPLVGAAPTTDFERAFGEGAKRRRDFSLPAAVAMSGAALSPSMGKMTRRPFTFLMALANIRLGVWVPNPRWILGPENAKRRLFERPRPWYLLQELLGRNRIDAKYLYVTDGGHYENLGLVELLRRGCTEIYCFDASGGEGFGELGDAIAIARSELGVEIEIDPTALMPVGPDDTAPANAVIGTFSYKDGTAGTLVYARNVMTARSPWDVRAYHERDPAFPHNPTADQLYTDQKFEGYRALGEAAGRRAVELMGQPAGTAP
jgi:hypothetical protein